MCIGCSQMVSGWYSPKAKKRYPYFTLDNFYFVCWYDTSINNFYYVACVKVICSWFPECFFERRHQANWQRIMKGPGLKYTEQPRSSKNRQLPIFLMAHLYAKKKTRVALFEDIAAKRYKQWYYPPIYLLYNYKIVSLSIPFSLKMIIDYHNHTV